MSCINGTTPIDINISNVLNNCDLKCNYNFKYSNVNPILQNNNEYLKLSYENTSRDTVSYNMHDYFVKEIRIYSPSLHSYNSIKTEGEMIIIHGCDLGQSDLLVCVPIKINGTNIVGSEILKKIINTASISTPTTNSTTTLNNTQFNLSSFIPTKTPFYSYSGTLPYQPCNLKVDFVVFSIVNTSINIDVESLGKLKQIIVVNEYDIKKGINLFYNSKGGNTNTNLSLGDNNEIYIDCQPTDISEEEKEVVVEEYSTTPITLESILSNHYFEILIYTLIIFIVIFIFYLILQNINIPL